MSNEQKLPLLTGSVDVPKFVRDARARSAGGCRGDRGKVTDRDVIADDEGAIDNSDDSDKCDEVEIFYDEGSRSNKIYLPPLKQSKPLNEKGRWRIGANLTDDDCQDGEGCGAHEDDDDDKNEDDFYDLSKRFLYRRASARKNSNQSVSSPHTNFTHTITLDISFPLEKRPTNVADPERLRDQSLRAALSLTPSPSTFWRRLVCARQSNPTSVSRLPCGLRARVAPFPVGPPSVDPPHIGLTGEHNPFLFDAVAQRRRVRQKLLCPAVKTGNWSSHCDDEIDPLRPCRFPSKTQRSPSRDSTFTVPLPTEPGADPHNPHTRLPGSRGSRHHQSDHNETGEREGERAAAGKVWLGSGRKLKEFALDLSRGVEDWILTALVGAATAASAAWIEWIAEFLSDLRFGLCVKTPWLHQWFCCGDRAAVDLRFNRCRPVLQIVHLPAQNSLEPHADRRLEGDSNSSSERDGDTPSYAGGYPDSGDEGTNWLLESLRPTSTRASWTSWSELLLSSAPLALAGLGLNNSASPPPSTSSPAFLVHNNSHSYHPLPSPLLPSPTMGGGVRNLSVSEPGVSSGGEVRTRLLMGLIDAWMYVGVAVALAVVSGFLCVSLAPEAGGSGIPEVKTILGGFNLPRALAPMTLVVKLVALAMAVGSGLGLGKEGPMVQIGSSWAELFAMICNKVTKHFEGDPSRKNALLSAGSAAGVSTAFGAPVGGVLFALEEVSTYFPPSTLYRTLFCAIVASLFLKKVTTVLGTTGNGTVFQLDAIAVQGRWAIEEIFPFLIIAILGGLIGALFIHLSAKLARFRKHPLEAPPLLRRLVQTSKLRQIFFVILVVASVSYLHPMLRISSTFLMTNLFTRCDRALGSSDNVNTNFDIYNLCVRVPTVSTTHTHTLTRTVTHSLTQSVTHTFEGMDAGPSSIYTHNVSWLMLFSLASALVIYFLNALFTLGLLLPSGLFVPCLTIGALIGRIVGLLTIRLDARFHLINSPGTQPHFHPGVYSLLGALAVLGGVTRMTVSLVVIAFEMTGGLGYIVPFMLVTLVSRTIAQFIVEPSIYDVAMCSKRYPFLHPTLFKCDQKIAKGKIARDIITQEVAVLYLNIPWTISSLYTFLSSHMFNVLPALTDPQTRLLRGYVTRSSLHRQVKRLLKYHFQPSTPVIFTAVAEDYPRDPGPASNSKLNPTSKSNLEESRGNLGGDPGSEAGFIGSLPSLSTPKSIRRGEWGPKDCSASEFGQTSSTGSPLSAALISPLSTGAEAAETPATAASDRWRHTCPSERTEKQRQGIDLSHFVRPVAVQVSADISLIRVHELFLHLGVSFLLFTTEGRLSGILTKKAFLHYFSTS